MSKQAGWAWLTMAWLLLGAALLLVGGSISTSEAEVQVAKVIVDPTSMTISEPSGSGIVSLTLTSEPVAIVSIDLITTSNQCAVSVSSVDIDATNWGTGVTVTITAIDDDIVDGTQNCKVDTAKTRSDDPVFNGLSVRNIGVTVLDDDVPQILVAPTSMVISEPVGSEVFTLTTTSQPGAAVSVPITTSNSQCTTSLASAILDATNWASGVTVTVTAVDDSITDGTQTCLVQTGPSNSTDLSYLGLDPDDVTVTVNDDDGAGIFVDPISLIISEPSGSGLFTLSLTYQPTASVSIPLSALGGECTVSPDSVSLDEANWAVGVTATVTAVDDVIADGTQICLIETGPAGSADARYNDAAVDDVTVAVQDDEVPGILVVPASMMVAEPVGSGSLTLTLASQPTATVSVLVVASNSQCTVLPSLVSLDEVNWATGVTATVTAIDDAIADGSQICLVQTGPSTSDDHNYVGLSAQDVIVTVDDDDLAGIDVNPASLTISEPSGSDIFTVTLTSEPTTMVSVPLLAPNGQCVVSPESVSLDETNWATGVAASVTAVDDAVADGIQTCLVQTGPSSSADPEYDGRNPDDVIVKVHDDDVRGVLVAPTELSITEPSGSAIFILTLTSEPTVTVSIGLTVSGTECTVSPDSVSLDEASWATGVTATVSAVDDSIVDGAQACLVETGPSTSADLGYSGLNPDDVTVTVYDDEAPGIFVNPTSLIIGEPHGSAIFALKLTSQPVATVSLPLTALGGQCEVSPDSVSLDDVNWAAGVTATVTAVDDAIADGTQVCLVQTGSASSADPKYADLNPEDVSVAVEDDEEPGILVQPISLIISEPSGSGSFTLTLIGPPTATVSVPVVASNNQCTVLPNLVSLDEVNWATGVTATVTAIDDSIADGLQTCLVQTGPSTSDDPNYVGLGAQGVIVTVSDDDLPGINVDPTSLTISEPSGSGIFTVTLTSEPTTTVSVPLLAPDDQCGVSPSSVSLDASDWAGGVTATVTAIDDSIADGARTCLVQTGDSTSTALSYIGLNPDDVTVTVLDDDEPGMQVDPSSLIISEPSGLEIISLTLTSEPTATVSVPLMALDGQCEVSPDSVSLDEANWAAGVTATVTAVDDAVADGTQICLVKAGPTTSADANYDGRNPVSVTVSVHDDDEPGISVEPASLTISEPSGSETITLTLSSQPTATVSIPLSVSNGECDVSPSSVDLDLVDWATGVTATVTAMDDSIEDGSQSCMVQIGPASSADHRYRGRNASDVNVTVQDDDAVFRVYLPTFARAWPPVPGIPTLYHIANTDGNGSYTINWSSVPQADVYVLEEATDSLFSDAGEIYNGASASLVVHGRGAAQYHYRVKAGNAWGDSDWSNVRQVDVLWEAEPNGLPLIQANGPIASGLTYYGTFPSSADESDYFYFKLSTPRPVELWLTGIPVDEDYNLVLRDAQLAVVGYSGELGNDNEHIVTSALPAGRYHIQIFNFSGGGSSQPYELKAAYD